jgi:hypothetical protein
MLVAAVLSISPSLAVQPSMATPMDTLTITTTVNGTTTSTSITVVSATSSSLQVMTTTSVITQGTTQYTFQSGRGGIPGFPLEGILLGSVIGLVVLALLRRRPQRSV